MEIELLKSLDHSCKYPGCKHVFVLYGNMKNRRDVCMARDAGYTAYEGLPGVLKTGCMNTPDFKARHCTLHRVRACIPYTPSDSDEAAPEKNESGDKIVEMILEKIITRKAIYYKVILPPTFHQIFKVFTM